MRSLEDFKKHFNALINNSCIDVNNAAWSVINFSDEKPSAEEIAAMVKKDPKLAEVNMSGGHNSINYPDELTIENIVITNIQEILIESAGE